MDELFHNKSFIEKSRENRKRASVLKGRDTSRSWNTISRRKRERGINAWAKSFAGRKHYRNLARHNALGESHMNENAFTTLMLNIEAAIKKDPSLLKHLSAYMDRGVTLANLHSRLSSAVDRGIISTADLVQLASDVGVNEDGGSAASLGPACDASVAKDEAMPLSLKDCTGVASCVASPNGIRTDWDEDIAGDILVRAFGDISKATFDELEMEEYLEGVHKIELYLEDLYDELDSDIVIGELDINAPTIESKDEERMSFEDLLKEAHKRVGDGPFMDDDDLEDSIMSTLDAMPYNIPEGTKQSLASELYDMLCDKIGESKNEGALKHYVTVALVDGDVWLHDLVGTDLIDAARGFGAEVDDRKDVKAALEKVHKYPAGAIKEILVSKSPIEIEFGLD